MDAEQKYQDQPPVALSLIGGFALSVQGRRSEMSSSKARAMFAHIALSPDMEQSRERLAGLLWGDSPERRARASLRGALLALRETLGEFADQVLSTSNANVTVLRDGLQVDVLEIGNWLRAGRVPELLLQHQNICESILANAAVLDDAFVEWLTVYRQTTQENWMRLLQEILRNGQELNARRDAATAIRNLDTLHEESCRFLMQYAAGQGDTAGALRIYNALYEKLGDEYDMEPAEETQALVELVKLGRVEKLEQDETPRETSIITPLFARPNPAQSTMMQGLSLIHI